MRMSLPDENDSFRLNEYAHLTGYGGGSLFSGAKCHRNERKYIQNEERKKGKGWPKTTEEQHALNRMAFNRL